MKYNPTIHNRRSVRLKEYDYAQEGAYFITICCHNRASLFGEIINGEMILNANGKIAYHEWLKTTEIRLNVELDVFVIMPNHIHGIVIINNDRRGVLHTPVSIPNPSDSRGVSHTPVSIPNPSDSRGVSHTPVSITNPSEKYGPVLHTSAFDIEKIENKSDVFHTPDLIIDKFDNKSNALDTPVINNTHISIHNQGVCNTPPQKNILRSPSNTIGAMVRGYKSAVTKQLNILNAEK